MLKIFISGVAQSKKFDAKQFYCS